MKVTYTVQAGQKLRLTGYCGCQEIDAGQTVDLFPAYAQHFIERGVIA